MRQPWSWVSLARSGRKMSWPVALLAASMPTTRPRRSTNQRVATVAPSTRATRPVPKPTMTPHSATSCQTSVIASEARMPSAIVAHRRDDDRPDAEAVDEGGRKRRHQPEERDAQGEREGDIGGAPAEFLSSGSMMTPGAPIAPAVASMTKRSRPRRPSHSTDCAPPSPRRAGWKGRMPRAADGRRGERCRPAEVDAVISNSHLRVYTRFCAKKSQAAAQASAIVRPRRRPARPRPAAALPPTGERPAAAPLAPAGVSLTAASRWSFGGDQAHEPKPLQHFDVAPDGRAVEFCHAPELGQRNRPGAFDFSAAGCIARQSRPPAPTPRRRARSSCARRSRTAAQ